MQGIRAAPNALTFNLYFVFGGHPMSKATNRFIVRTPGVLGGRPRLDGTRVAVRTIAIWYKKG